MKNKEYKYKDCKNLFILFFYNFHCFVPSQESTLIIWLIFKGTCIAYFLYFLSLRMAIMILFTLKGYFFL